MSSSATGVCFINDRQPRATSATGDLQTEADWKVVPTVVKAGASIGSGAVILCGVTIGENALVGAGAVVTRDIPAGEVWVGNPARFLRKVSDREPSQFPAPAHPRNPERPR